MDTPDIPDTLPTGQYAIYVLVDPTDELIYYVGQTRIPKRRLICHLGDRHHKGAKGDWLRRLTLKGERPLMQILEIVMGRKVALSKEREWIRYLQEKGMPLLNAKGRPIPGKPIIPLWQRTIQLFDYPVVVVLLPGECIAISLASLCNILKITKNMQVRRIHDDKVLAACLLPVLIQTPGGPQVSNVLIHWAVPIWASGLHTASLLEEKRALALLIRKEAVAAIEQALAQP